jgi:DNA-binding transcriptional LysR family regulator
MSLCCLRLFTRHKQRIAPTAEAHLFLVEVENLFQNLARLDRWRLI